MTRLVDRLKLVFLGVFALACAGAWAYQLLVVSPAQQCEANGNWWDRERRICGVVVDVRTFTRLYAERPARNPAPAAGAPASSPAPSAVPAR
jgi:hypothetical protein